MMYIVSIFSFSNKSINTITSIFPHYRLNFRAAFQQFTVCRTCCSENCRSKSIFIYVTRFRLKPYGKSIWYYII